MGLVMGVGEFGSGTFDDGTFDVGTPAVVVTTTTSSGGGSSGGGGGGYVRNGLSEGSKTLTFNYGDAFIFHSKGYKHTTVILKVTEDSVKIRITSNPIELTLKVGEIVFVDTDNNGLSDFSVTLNSISKYGGSFTFTIMDEKAIETPVVDVKVDEPIVDETKENDTVEAIPAELPEDITIPIDTDNQIVWVFFGVLALIIIVLGIIIFNFNKRKKNENGKQKT